MPWVERNKEEISKDKDRCCAERQTRLQDGETPCEGGNAQRRAGPVWSHRGKMESGGERWGAADRSSPVGLLYPECTFRSPTGLTKEKCAVVSIPVIPALWQAKARGFQVRKPALKTYQLNKTLLQSFLKKAKGCTSVSQPSSILRKFCRKSVSNQMEDSLYLRNWKATLLMLVG